LHVAWHLCHIRPHLVGQFLSSGMQPSKQFCSCWSQTLQQTEALTGPLPVDDRAQGIASRTPRIKSFLTSLSISILSFSGYEVEGKYCRTEWGRALPDTLLQVTKSSLLR
jgi:hypothetical protein